MREAALPRRKKFVRVNADFQADGTVLPKSIRYRGKEYPILELLGLVSLADDCKRDKKRCYTVRIQKKTTRLFWEDGRWYVWAKVYPGEEFFE